MIKIQREFFMRGWVIPHKTFATADPDQDSNSKGIHQEGLDIHMVFRIAGLDQD
jgi:hypothetical protein